MRAGTPSLSNLNQTKNMKIRSVKYVGAFLAMIGSLWALPEAGTIEAAVAKAKAENRTVIVEFTGRDWCGACKHLHGKIFSSSEFENAVNDLYVVTELDYPRAPELLAQLSDDEKARRQKIMDSYGVQGLPTVVLMDSDGLPFAIIVGTRPKPSEYLKELDKAQAVRAQRDAAFQKAQGLTGLDKAKALVEGLSILPKTCQDKYEAVLKEIISLDPENTLGYNYVLGATERRVEQLQSFQKLCSTFRGHFQREDLEKDLAKLDEFLSRKDLLPEIRQEALATKSDCYAFLHDVPNMLQSAKEAYAIDPNSRMAARLKKNIDHIEQFVIPQMEAEKAAKDGQNK